LESCLIIDSGIIMDTLGTSPDVTLKASVRLATRLLAAPVQAIVHFFAPWQQQRLSDLPQSSAQLVAHHFTACAANSQRYATAARANDAAAHDPRCIRVLRVVDASCTSHSAGRMKISGRFSDVCAELDRLSQQEAA
jgi:hypothetical protein